MAIDGKKDFQLKGIGELMTRLNKELELIQGHGAKGLILAARYIRQDMEDTPPLIPVDKGNLRASFFVVSAHGGDNSKNPESFKGKDGSKMRGDHSATVAAVSSVLQINKYPVVAMGFSANYATYVHENLEANFGGRPDLVKRTKTGKIKSGGTNLRRPGAGPRFFAAALSRNYQKILEIVRENAQVK